MSDTNSKRLLQLYTSLSQSPVWLVKLSGVEGLSQLFHYQLHLATQQPLPAPATLIGKPISFGIKATPEQAGRDFNGLLMSLASTSDTSFPGWYYYEATVVPWLWLLTQRSNCRIFPGNGKRQSVAITAILQELFKDYAAYSVDTAGIKGQYPQRDFWVQYHETDLAFFSRLAQSHGIFYYFKQEQGKHQLILADQSQGYGAQAAKPYPLGIPNSLQPQLHYWKHRYQFTAAKWTVNSHNLQQPNTQLQASSNSCVSLARSGPCEHYLYSGNYQNRDQGKTLATLKMEAEETRYSTVEAHSNIVSLSAGGRVLLDKQFFPQESETEFVVTYLEFTAEDGNLPGMPAQLFSYSNKMHCIPAKQVFRSLLPIEKPQVVQLHEAIVTGPQGEEIYTDALGRLRIQFIWDRLGSNDANSSCWVRTASQWEGVLRVGTPVLVGFLQGDIDQPIVLGPLYDAMQKPLFSEVTMSGLKRRQGSHGDDSYYNELRFNDKKEQAQVFLHACKDMQLAVDNDLTTVIQHNEQHTVTQQRHTEIQQGDDQLLIKQGNLVITLKQGKCELNVQGDVVISSNSNMTLHAAQTLKLSAGQGVEVQAGSSLTQKAASVSILATTNLDLEGATAILQGTTTSAIKGGLVEFN